MAVPPDQARPVTASILAGLTGLATTILLLAGCASASAPPASQISLLNAFIMQPGGSGSVAAYLVISNRGAADKLLSVHCGAGGIVALIDPAAPGSTAIQNLRTVQIPSHSVLRMSPAGLRLIILNPGPMRTGKAVALTLDFARAGPITIQAEVTNSQTGGSSYFGP